MSSYLLINIFIIFFPLILSFEKKIRFYRKWIPLTISTVITGLFFILWDIIAVNRNDWSFNNSHVSDIKIFNLPPEEILFFVTVPYSIIFTFACVKFYLKDRVFRINRKITGIVALIFISAGLYYWDKNYTITVLLLSGILIFLLNTFSKDFLYSKIYLVSLLISYIPFLIINYILTSVPVVIYNTEAITGIKFLTIPAEDFLYSFSMITMWIFIFDISDRHLSNKEKNDLSFA